MNNLKPKQILSGLCLTLFIQSFAANAFSAQYDFQKVKAEQKKHIELMRDYHIIKEPVAFPDLPVFSGQSKFIVGYYSPNHNGVSSCHMQFVSQEDPQAVLAFYKEALAADKWKIGYSSVHGLCARHSMGHMCNINVNDSKIPKMKSEFTIDYRQIEQQQH